MGGMRGGPGGKKMRKRKELDALVGGVGVKRSTGGCKRPGSGGVSPQDQLLSESTGEEEYWSSAKGGSGKGRKLYCTSHGKRHTSACTALLRLCTILLVMACVVATITVMWLFIDIKEQTTSLRSQLDQVSAGSDVIPESIQKCHSLTRQLEKNQTKINIQLQRVAQRLSNFSSMMIGIQTNLTKVERKLDDSPSPQLVPDMLERVGVTIAAFKAEILDMQSKASNIVNQQSEIKKLIDGLTGNVSSFNNDLKELKKHSSGMMPSDQSSKDDLLKLIIGEMEPKIQQVNSTILSRVKWISDDLQKAQKTINNLTDESEYLKSLINTTLHDLKLQSRDINTLRSDIKAYTKEWEELIVVTKTLESNVSKLATSCSQCKYTHNEDSITSTPIPSASEMSKSSPRKMPDIPLQPQL